MWITPKTEWRSTDFYNIEDWRRVRTNLEHICEYLENHKTSAPELLSTDNGKGYDEMPYVHLVNNMEHNLATLLEVFGTSFVEDVAPRTWYDRLDTLYTTNPTYRDWNRWETVLRCVYESIQYIDTYVFQPISGSCRCGSERTLIRFSKGR